MNFIPKKQKFKKQQKGKHFNRVIGISLLNNLHFGSIGLQALESSRLTSKQLVAFHFLINKFLKKIGRLVFLVFPHTPVSKKPIEIRMGKGKGNVDHWVAKVKYGCIICQIETRSIAFAVKALKLAKLRLPFNTRIVYSK